MNPLSCLNIALSVDEICALSEQVIAQLAIKLVEVETELSATINQ
jgi:hypothetical protein